MNPPFSRTPLAARIHELPLVLAGPIVRRVEPGSVTVWVALRRACRVHLRVRALDDDRALLHGSRDTVAVGEHLHLVAVTAVGSEPGAEPLERGQIVGYDMSFDPADGAHPCLASLFSPDVFARDPAAARAALLYEHGPAWPSFAVLPERVEDLRILHGSCRRPNRGGIDAMPELDRLIARAPGARAERPHLLVLTGDNIYSDEAGHPRAFLDLIADCAQTLLGWREYLPGYECHADEVPLDGRFDVPEHHMGHPEPPRVQLFSLGEFLALYLLLLSDTLWPADFPDQGETAALADMSRRLPRVRRALANIATYAVFDDHDVSDDWNLNRFWCESVYDQPLGRRVVQNALVSFALVHTWGNRPDSFAGAGAGEAPGPGFRLLELVRAWRPTGPDADAPELRRILGIPDSGAALHAHGRPPRLWHDPDALDWHFRLHAPDYRLLFLDVRSWRAFPGRTRLSFPDLLSDEALERQLPAAWLADADALAATIVVSSIPVFHAAETRLSRALGYIKAFFRGLYGWIRGRTTIRAMLSFGRDDGDVWSPRTRSFSELLTRLLSCRRVVILSGDVHVAFAARATVQRGDRRAVFAQLTSSGMLNEKPSLRPWHEYGYNQPWPFCRTPAPSCYALGSGDVPCEIQYVRADREQVAGREVVGNNNIGEVVFARRGDDLLVEQRTWWRDGGDMAPHTRFTVVLDEPPGRARDP